MKILTREGGRGRRIEGGIEATYFPQNEKKNWCLVPCLVLPVSRNQKSEKKAKTGHWEVGQVSERMLIMDSRERVGE